MSVDTQTHSGISAAVVPVGSVITYHSDDWKTNYFSGTTDIVSKVANILAQNGMAIRSHSESVGGIMGNIDSYIGLPATFSVDMQVQITGGLGYSSPDDPASIIDNAVYQVTGLLPTHSVPTVKIPGAGLSGMWDSIKSFFTGKQSTGQPLDSPSTGLSLANITSGGTLWIALVIVGFVGALALIGYSGALKRGGG